MRLANIKKGTEYPASVQRMAIYKTPEVDASRSSTAMYFLSSFAVEATGGSVELLFAAMACGGAAAVVLLVSVTVLIVKRCRGRKRQRAGK